jgi:type II secretory pathway predicted ATPase ExeA
MLLADEGVENWRWFEQYLSPAQYSQILEIRRKLATILDNNVLPHFTDHTLEHCDRIADIARRLTEQNINRKNNQSLHRDELFVLALGILFHDVGMQIPKAHGIETPISELSREELGQIRRNHGKVSGKIVRELADEGDEILHLGLTERNVRRFLPFAATLCENHQSSADYDPDEVVKVGAETIRVGLITVILRLADQLDCDWRRVEIDRLDHFSIPLESILHWLVCSYIDAVTIENGLVEISASFHDSMTGPEIEYISHLLLRKLHDEYKAAEKTLWRNDVQVGIPEALGTTGADFTHKKRALPQQVLELIKNELSANEPKYVVAKPSATPEGEEIDFMSYWQVIGNPFLDRPVSYGTGKFVETKALKLMMAELGGFLKGAEGELKLVIGPRGMGKTTLFQCMDEKFSEKYDVFVIDVGEKVREVRNIADLNQLIIYSIQGKISKAEPTGVTEDIIEAARLGNKKVICVDSLDRLPEEKDSIVVDFFKAAQNTLAKLQVVSVVIFAFADRWARFLTSNELPYLGYRNQWQLSPFTTEDIIDMLNKRLKASGKSFDQIFEPNCGAILRTLSNGNPREVLKHAEAICRFGAQKKQQRITARFIHDQYEKDFDQALEALLDRFVKSSADLKKGLISIYHFYLEMERRNLDTNEGWSYLIELVETGIQPNRIQGSFLTPLRFVSQPSGLLVGGLPSSKVSLPLPFVKALFKELKNEGYSARDFITFYGTNPVAPSAEEDDLEVRFKSPLLMGPDVEYFEKSRQLFIATKRSPGPAFQVISNAWDCVEDMIFAILLKANHPEVNALIAKKEEWFVEDRFGIRRFVKGAGRMRAEHAGKLVSVFVAFLKERGIWMASLVSLNWIRGARGNVVRGRTEHLTQYSERERDLCLRHLDAVYKELSQIYG